MAQGQSQFCFEVSSTKNLALEASTWNCTKFHFIMVCFPLRPQIGDRLYEFWQEANDPSHSVCNLQLCLVLHNVQFQRCLTFLHVLQKTFRFY